MNFISILKDLSEFKNILDYTYHIQTVQLSRSLQKQCAPLNFKGIPRSISMHILNAFNDLSGTVALALLKTKICICFTIQVTFNSFFDETLDLVH